VKPPAIFISLLLFSVLLPTCSQKKASEETYYTVEDYRSVKKFDSHIHIVSADTTFIKQSAEDNFGLLTVNVDAPSVPPFEEQRKYALQDISQFPDLLAFATTFPVNNWNEDTWQEQALAYLEDSFSKGAIAVKIWKNVGMDLRDKNGDLVMIDNPRFDRILNYLEENNIPLIGHFGEPKNCWLPIEEMTVNDYKGYYRNNPQYHMYLHPGITTYEEQVEARDRMLEKHPDLTFVGAHLGSLEWSVDELALRLDKFPNMAVDMAERISHFQEQAQDDREKVRDFFIKYQDRLIYATDFIIDGTMSPAEMKEHVDRVRLSHWKFFTTDETMNVPHSVDGDFQGLKLPREVIDKIYYNNAHRWFPAIKFLKPV
jgi:predicted TIM-barrel fold metal-dependent hydrolase